MAKTRMFHPAHGTWSDCTRIKRPTSSKYWAGVVSAHRHSHPVPPWPPTTYDYKLEQTEDDSPEPFTTEPPNKIELIGYLRILEELLLSELIGIRDPCTKYFNGKLVPKQHFLRWLSGLPESKQQSCVFSDGFIASATRDLEGAKDMTVNDVYELLKGLAEMTENAEVVDVCNDMDIADLVWTVENLPTVMGTSNRNHTILTQLVQVILAESRWKPHFILGMPFRPFIQEFQEKSKRSPLINLWDDWTMEFYYSYKAQDFLEIFHALDCRVGTLPRESKEPGTLEKQPECDTKTSQHKIDESRSELEDSKTRIGGIQNLPDPDMVSL